MTGARKTAMMAVLTVFAIAGAGTVPAAAATTGGLLPHPGPDGLVWVEERTGDGGVASGGAWNTLPTVLTVACEGGGDVRVTMESQGVRVAAFAVDCPVGDAGVGSVAMDPGVVRPGSFSVGVDASHDDIRWALTVTQPE
ncbi:MULTISPECIES: hypothetical protein [Streptomyces]|uniref:hypothetical protein n=1 Tax=Streptomyces TaxID=1883 RepID=UPI001AF77E55|nr:MULTISPECIES: hypothetical protein [unclassified Streptomyces]CAD5912155.1 conserved exported protein of unknown function [Streptomyces sp. KY70]CAD5995117.1 conserved exported protein of unknown function [Streptomyces sp. KY75]